MGREGERERERKVDGGLTNVVKKNYHELLSRGGGGEEGVKESEGANLANVPQRIMAVEQTDSPPHDTHTPTVVIKRKKATSLISLTQHFDSNLNKKERCRAKNTIQRHVKIIQ